MARELACAALRSPAMLALLALLLLLLPAPFIAAWRATDDAAGINRGQTNCNNVTEAVQRLRAIGLPWSDQNDFYLLSRLRLADHLQSPEFLAYERQQQASQGGRGILIPAGGRGQMLHAYLGIKVLREKVHCKLPVEVVYNGPNELHPQASALLRQLPGVTLVDGAAVAFPPHHSQAQVAGRSKGLSFKVWALAYVTSFKEVLLMDSDNMALLDPTELFDSLEYRAHHNLFWPDWIRGDDHPAFKPKPGIYRSLGLPVPWDGPDNAGHRTTESGQLLLDRGRYAAVLEWLWWLNAHEVHISEYLHGDKDTFPIAFKLAGLGHEYQQVKWQPRQALANWKVDDSFHHRGMVQHAPDGRLAFHHRTAGSKLLEVCTTLDADVENCRVVALSVGLSPVQAVHSSHRGWSWRDRDLELASHQLYKCGLKDPLKQVGLQLFQRQLSALAQGTNSSSGSSGNKRGSKKGGLRRLLASRTPAARSARAMLQELTPAEHQPSRWHGAAAGTATVLPAWLTCLGRQGLRCLGSMGSHGRSLRTSDFSLSWSLPTAADPGAVERRLLVSPPPVPGAAMATLRAAGEHWQQLYQKHGALNTTWASWPELQCAKPVQPDAMPLPMFPLQAYGPVGQLFQEVYAMFEHERNVTLLPLLRLDESLRPAGARPPPAQLQPDSATALE